MKVTVQVQILGVIWLVAASSRASLHPFILIPGDGGSQVEAKLSKPSVVHYLCDKTSDWFSLWLNLELLVPLVIDCWVDNFKLHYDNVTRKTTNSPGVTIRIPNFGDPSPVEWLDPTHNPVGSYFKYIGNELVAMGYERNVSIRGAPFDFRKAPAELGDFFDNLKSLVEETYTANNNTQVILLSHSMGSPISLVFLQKQTQDWKNKYIRCLVSLAGAWAGSVKAVKVFAMGDDLGSYVLRNDVLYNQQITAPSLAWLMPSKLFWKDSEILVQMKDKNFTIETIKGFFEAINYMNGWEMYLDSLPFSSNFTPPGVEVHCLHGIGVPTVEKLVYKDSFWWWNKYPTLVQGDGDGTVNTRSLKACQQWQGKQKQNIFYQSFPNIDHMGVLSNKQTIDYIKSMLNRI